MHLGNDLLVSLDGIFVSTYSRLFHLVFTYNMYVKNFRIFLEKNVKITVFGLTNHLSSNKTRLDAVAILFCAFVCP